MDSNGRTQPLLVGLLIISVIVCLDFELVLSLQSNAYLSERVTFYPASLIVSHNPKPLTFYENTKLLNVHTVFNFTDFGERLSMSNHSCSLHDGRFFNEILNSVRDFQKTLRRLLSLPRFSTSFCWALLALAKGTQTLRLPQKQHWHCDTDISCICFILQLLLLPLVFTPTN